MRTLCINAILVICVMLSVPAAAQEISKTQLIDSTLAILPRIITIAEAGPGKMAELRGVPAPVSYSINDSFASSADNIAYFTSTINLPVARETRVIETQSLKTQQRKYYWSIIIDRESNQKSLYGSPLLDLFKLFDSSLVKRFPQLKQVRDKGLAPGGAAPHSRYVKLVSGNKYEIGLVAWHLKYGNRNQLQLYVTSLQ